MSLLSQFMGGSGIKSIQRGMHFWSNENQTISISSVNLSKAILIANASIKNGGISTNLSSSTQISCIAHHDSPDGSPSGHVAWQVIEYY